MFFVFLSGESVQVRNVYWKELGWACSPGHLSTLPLFGQTHRQVGSGSTHVSVKQSLFSNKKYFT